MIEMSENIKELATALSKTQAKIEAAVKGSENPEFQMRYANLAAVWAACRNALTKNGLSVVQFPGEISGNFMCMTTMLMHSSGQWIRQPLSIPLSRLDAQEYGAATTYARRYALAAVVGVCPEDGDGLSVSAASSRLPDTHVAPPTGYIDEEQLAALTDLAMEVGADHRAFCDYLGIASLGELPASQYEAARHALEYKRSVAGRVVQ